MRFMKNCRARGVTNRGPPVTLLKEHNHSKNFDLQPIYDFKQELYKTVTSSFRDLRSIYDELCVKCVFLILLYFNTKISTL